MKAEATSGLPQLQIKPDRAAIARYGLNVEDVNDMVESVVAGKDAGQVYEGEQRFNLVVRLDEESGKNVDSIRNLLLTAPNGSRVLLSQVADIQLVEDAAQITREDTRRRIGVELNVRGRDIGSFVEEAQGLFGVRPEIRPLASYDPVLSRIEALVPGSGTLADRVEAYQNRFTIPREKLEPVFRQAISACRQATVENIALPSREAFDLARQSVAKWEDEDAKTDAGVEHSEPQIATSPSIEAKLARWSAALPSAPAVEFEPAAPAHDD